MSHSIPKYLLSAFIILICTSAYSQTVTANFTANPTSGCAPLTVYFNNTSTGASSYSWNFNNGAPLSQYTNPSTTFQNPGTYNVVLTAINGSVQSQKTVVVTVYSPPVVNFYASPLSVCLGKPITFTDISTLNSPGPASYQWNFGNGQGGTGSPITYTYNTSGTFNVTLTVTNSAGCIANTVKSNYITIIAPPAGSFTASSTTTCTNTPITFFNTTTSTSSFTSTWYFGDNTGPFNATNPVHSYTSPGTYSVTLITVNGTGCKDSITYANYITVIPGTVASFTGPASVCPGQIATFTNTSTPGFTSCSWNFGDNSSGVGSPVSHAYGTSGTYYVKLLSTNNNCSDSVTHTIVVNPLPAVNMSFNPQLPCPAPTTVAISTTTPGSSYYWRFGDGDTSHLQNPNHTYTWDDTFTVTLVVTSAAGCPDSLTDSLIILPINLSIGDSATNHCIPFTVYFFDTATFTYQPYPGAIPSQLPYPSPVTSWTWNFGDGTGSTQRYPNHNYTVYGTYVVTLTITTANGCTKTDSITILAGTPDTANFTAAPQVICVRETVFFTNFSSGATNYVWDFGDGTGAVYAAPNPGTSHQYTLPGVFTVTLEAINNGCADTMTKTLYITVHPPKSIFFVHYNCAIYNQVHFLDSAVRATSFIWYFGDGTIDSVNKYPTHNYPGIGYYNVKFVTYNDSFGCHDTSQKIITISHPVANIATPDTAVCKNSPITLSGSLTGTYVPPATGHEYSWFLDGVSYIDTIYLRTHTFATTGQKQVMLVIIDYRGCLDTTHRTLLVAWPTVNFVASDTTVCIQSSVTLTDQSTDAVTTSFTNRKWNFGDGSPILNGNNPNPVHAYTTAGTFNVSLKITDNVGCTDSLTKQAYISVHNPLAGFTTPNLTVCKKSQVQFYNLSQGVNLTYKWYFGDNGTSTLFQPTHAYMQPGVYSVSLVVTDNIGCKDSVGIPNYLTVVDDPYASFSLTDTFSVCSPVTDTFTNTSVGGSSYYWTFGDGNNSIFQNAVNVYSAPGLFTVQMVVTNNAGCKDTAYAHVNILGYSGLVTYTPLTGCAPLLVTYTAHVNGVSSIVYDFNDGNTLATTSTTATHTYLYPGAFTPRIILNGIPGCSSSSVGNDLIKVDGVYGGFSYIPFPACGSDTVHFTDTSHAAFSSIINTKWIFHDNTTSSSHTPSHYYLPGTYSVTLIESTSTGCVDTFLKSLSVYNIPVISAGRDTTVCVGDSALLTGHGGVSYTWTPVATLSCPTCSSTYAGPAVQTKYIVIGTDIHGCTNTDTVVVSLKTKSAGSADSSGAICRLASIQLHAHAFDSAAKYTWIPSTGLDNSHSANPIASPNTTTKYMVLIQEGRCIPDTLFDNIIVHPTPTINLGPNQTIVAGFSYTISSSETNVVRYLWVPSTYLDCDTCADPTATPSKSTLYKVYVTSSFGCLDSAQILLDVICDHSQVFMPNTFTPNGDGANDRFYPHGKGLQIIKSFRIYDRWGEMIFERQNINLNDITASWDGTYNGKKLTPDIYVYVVDAICETGAPITWTGDVALIR